MSTTDRRRWSAAGVIRVVVTVVLGGIGAAAGFKHTHDWAVHHGQTGWLAWSDAVVIEGMAVVAGFEIQRDRQQQDAGLRPPRRVTFPVVVLVVAFGIQMAAQVALAEPTPAGWLLAAMPALGFLVVVKLLMRRTHLPTVGSADTAAAPAPVETPSAGVAREPEPDPVTEPAIPAATEPVAVDGASPAAPAVRAPSSASVPPADGSSPTGPELVSRLRLPADLADRVGAAVDRAHREGRHPTAADIRSAARVSDEMADRILEQLGPVARNGHPLPA